MSTLEAVKKEVKEVGSVTLFFLVGFVLILAIIKLILLGQYSVDIHKIGKAALGALIAGKTVVILDHTPLTQRFKDQPAAVRIVYKTLLYSAGAFAITFAERVFELRGEASGVGGAIALAVQGAHFYLLLAINLMVMSMFAIYNSSKEVGRVLGKGGWRSLFFGRPTGRTRNRT